MPSDPSRPHHPAARPGAAVVGRPHLVVKTWRDRFNPDAGGAEVWLDEVVARLRDDWDVTVLTQQSAGRPAHEVVDGVTYVRRGGVFSQYVLAHLTQARLPRSPDVVLDVFNGVPFLSALRRAHPVVVVVHHVHREQWSLMFGPVVGRVGWLGERTSGLLQRRCRHVTVSQASATAIATVYGVPPDRIDIAHNGAVAPPPDLPTIDLVPADRRLVALGRIVPHKRLDVAVAALARARAAGLDVHLDVVGDGEWRDDVVAAVREAGVSAHVTLHGVVDEATKHAILRASDLLVLPSVREGWGIVVTEAAHHGVPAVAMATAGGTAESVVDGVSGALAVDADDFGARVVALLADDEWRAELGRGAERLAARFTWEGAAATVDRVLRLARDEHATGRAAQPARHQRVARSRRTACRRPPPLTSEAGAATLAPSPPATTEDP